MSLLREIQENFQRCLQQNNDWAIQNYIVAPEADSANERLLIYKDGYYLRLIDALKADYRGVVALLGEREFEEMGSLYVDQKPSQHFSINVFGDNIPSFLEYTEPYSHRLELAEMAKFEFALNKAIHTLNAPVLLPQDMAQISQEKWADTKITPHPSVQILTLQWNVPELWRPAFEKEPLPELKQIGPMAWLVWQKDINTYYVSLSPQDSFIMESLKNDFCVAQICEGLCQWMGEEEVPQYLVQTILNWLHDKLLSKLG